MCSGMFTHAWSCEISMKIGYWEGSHLFARKLFVALEFTKIGACKWTC